MDALPIHEQTNLAWRSINPGVSHACGHDGHTTMLLGAARYLAEQKDFAGEAVFVFQPAEEGLGGARAMIADGLFDRFPVDEIYGLHNMPTDEPGRVAIRPGVALAGADFFDITLKGVGSHGAMPQDSKDPIVAATALVQALQSIVSRNLAPKDMAVLSVTQIHAGSAYNVIPSEAVVSGTARMFTNDVRQLIQARIREVSAGIAATFGMEVEVDIRDIFSVLVNDETLSHEFLKIAADMVGVENTAISANPATGSEDFADMLHAVPGAYFTIGHSGNVPLHNPGFVFDDAILPLGASLYARIVETRAAA
jgi:hippurate hydrolase